jgi:Ca2+-binding RTX toxin-like protein
MTTRTQKPEPAGRYRRRGLTALLTALLLLAGLVTASPAEAASTPADAAGENGPVITDGGTEGAPPPGEVVGSQDGYLFSRFPSASTVTYAGDGSENFSYNPTGEDITVERLSDGYYRVGLSSTSQNFVPTVSTFYGSGAHSCSVWSYAWPGSFVNVYCFDSAGTATDSRFTLRWTTTADDAAFYVGPTGIICCESVENPWGAAPSVDKTGTGEYVVTVPDSVNQGQGNIQVSAYRGDEEHCKVGKHEDEVALVMCFDISGNPVDSGFTYLEIGSEDDAFVWGNSPSAAGPYVADTAYSHNPQLDDPVITKMATGRYKVDFPNLLVAYGGSVATVSMGGDDNVCQVETWGPAEAWVRCFDNTGTAVDSEFGVLFTRFQVCAGEPATVEIGLNLPTGGDDVIVGTAAADTINALGGDDLVCAGGGDDLVIGLSGNDTIFGEDGNDVLAGNAGNDRIEGGLGDDTVYAGSGNDLVRGGDGNDILGGSSGDDRLYGENGRDRMSGGSDSDEVEGGAGDDAVNGGRGDDPAVIGGPGDDTVSGNGGNDKISGGDGNDQVRGGAGDDLVFGGDGNDFVAGNAGIDECDGEGGIDTAASSCETVVNVP